MPRGKRTCVWLSCTQCKNTNYNARINERNQDGGKILISKFCPECNQHTEHKSGKKITHAAKK